MFGSFSAGEPSSPRNNQPKFATRIRARGAGMRMLQPPFESEPPVCGIVACQGNEGIDVKEGCLNTRIENNYISLQHDDDAGGMFPALRYCSVR